MRKPIVAITCSYSDNLAAIHMSHFYADALYAAGAIGVYITRSHDPAVIAGYAQDFDGFLFSGGVDIDPKYYGESKEFDSVEIDPDRDNFEFALYTAIKDTQKPVFGICRGIQFLNVAEGGTLYQHIEGHMQSKSDIPGTQCPQEVHATPGGLLHRIAGKETFLTNTFHHQNVKEIAPTLKVEAKSADGYIECISKPGHPFWMATQWHPEMTRSVNEPISIAIFQAFADACQESMHRFG